MTTTYLHPFYVQQLYARVDTDGNLVGLNGLCSNSTYLQQYGTPYGEVKTINGPFRNMKAAVDENGKLLKIDGIGSPIADNYPVSCNYDIIGYKSDGNKKFEFICGSSVTNKYNDSNPTVFIIVFVLLFILVIVLSIIFPNYGRNRIPYTYTRAPVVLDNRPQTDTVNVNLSTNTISRLFGF